MPEISRFFGIIIRMFMEIEAQHSLPHFHAYYQGHVAVFGIESGDCLAGNLPRKQARLVQAWVELHRDELLNAWHFLQAGRLPKAIQPLQ